MKSPGRIVFVFALITSILITYPVFGFVGGDGSESNPWQIATKADLEAVNNDLNAHYILNNDINLTGTTYTKAVIAPFTDNSSPRFYGTFNGNGYAVIGLTVNGGTNDRIGLFAFIADYAEVRNLGIENCEIFGKTYIGGLAGFKTGSITSCYVSGNVNGYDYVGGLAGYNSGSITSSYANGTVTGNGNYVGGLVGQNYSGSVTISYASGTVTGYGDYVGGLVGDNYSGSVTSSYFLDTAGPDNGNGTSLTDAAMKQQSSFVGWDFVDETANGTHEIWQMPQGGGYPELPLFLGFIPPQLSGEGTSANPYMISNANELGAIIHYDDDANYQLTADIDLSGIQWSCAVIPVFDGNFDGNGHIISNLSIDGSSFLGLFGTILSSAEITDLSIENCSISGDNSVGGLVGKNNFGRITSSYVTGTITGDGSVGGVVGYNRDGSITGSYASGIVTGNNDVGGLVGANMNTSEIYFHEPMGYNNRGRITSCYASVTVTGQSSCVGGLVGDNNRGDITFSYTSGTVDGNSSVGGLVGNHYSGVITNSYSSCYVYGDDYEGGLVGENWDGIVMNSYFLDRSNNGYGTRLTDVEMKQQSNFVGWDFVNESANGTHERWQMPQGGGYPELTLFNSYIPPQLSGEGTSGSPYLISDANELGAIIHYDNDAVYQLITDIDLRGIQWSCAVIPVFDGKFDGNDHTIRNLKIDGRAHLGLFGFALSDAEINNLCIENCDISGQDSLGGLVGYNYGSITQSCSSGTATGDDYVGGLAGFNGDGSITSSYANGSATGDYSVGGLVGGNSGSITYSYATGTVTGNGNYVGGLVGDNYSGSITSCFASGTVTGNDSVGGMLGRHYGSFTNSYASGIVTGNNRIGGLVGYNQSSSTFISCYFLDTAGPNNGYGTALSDAVMKQQSSFFHFDFVSPKWKMLRENEDYPRLAWQLEYAGDIAGLYGVDIADIAALSMQWGEIDCGAKGDCNGADIDQSGVVDIGDLIEIANNWLEGK